MGVDASYVFPYRRGALKAIFQAVRRQQHYLAGGRQLAMVRADDEDKDKDKDIDKDAPPCVRLDIRRGPEPKYSDSSLRLYYTRGVIEVDDIIRYHRNDDSHERACKYYTEFFGHEGSVMPDYCHAWEYVEGGDVLHEDELLLELPRELLTAEDGAAFEAVHGPSERSGPPRAETCIRTGDVEALRALLDGDGAWKGPEDRHPARELARLAALCCRARSPLCLDLVLCRVEGLWPELDDRLSRSVEDGDVVTAGVLLEHGARSYTDDLYLAAKLGHRDTFELLLEKLVERRE
jgi:hypothetical protein